MPDLKIRNLTKNVIAFPGFFGQLAPEEQKTVTLRVAQIEQMRFGLMRLQGQGKIAFFVDYFDATPNGGLDAEFITVQDAGGGSGQSFTNFVPTGYPVGGIPAGSTFNAVDLPDMFQALLYGPAPLTGGEILGTVHFTFSTPSPLFIVGLLASDILDIQTVVIETPFNSLLSTLQLGTVASPGLVLGSGQVDPLVAASYQGSEKVEIAVPEILRLTINPSGSTQGQGFVLYRVRRT